MKELAEITFNDNRILLKDNLVRTPILPKLAREIERDVVAQGDCVLEGAVFARNFEIQQGPLRVKGPVFAQVELHVNTDAKGMVVFEKSVGSSNSIVSLAPGCRMLFLADVSAKKVKLRNAYVGASIFAEEVVLEDCIVVGGVFATRSLELQNCVVGTFNSPTVRASKVVYLLFPSAFSVERISVLPGTEIFNLTLADLGSLMRHVPPAENSGKIRINVAQDEVKSVLAGDGAQQILRSYSVVGKVLAADLVDYDKLQNHFLLSCAGMGSQLLHTYDLGLDAAGKVVELTPERIAEFFFDILHGKIEVSDLDGDFDISTIVRHLTPVAPVGESSAQGGAAVASTTIPDASTSDGATRVVEKTSPADRGATGLAAGGPVQRAAEVSNSPTAAELVSSVSCPHCGAKLEERSSFCDNCGKPQ